MTISLDARRYLTSRLQHQFIIKLRSGDRSNIPQHNKGHIYDNPRTNIIFNKYNAESFSSEQQEQDKDAHFHHLYSTEY